MTTAEAINQGRQKHRAGDLAAAEQIYRKVLQQQPDHPDALQLLGTVAAQRGDAKRAIELIRRALAIRPDNFEAQRNLGAMLANQGQFEQAQRHFLKAAELRPHEAQVHFDLGKNLVALNQLDEAQAALSKAVALRPDLAEAHGLLGDVLVKNDEIDAAMQAYQRVIALKPGFAEVHNSIGILLERKGRFGQAIASCTRAVQIKPDFAFGYFSLGNAYRTAGRLEEAIAAYASAIRCSSDFAEAYACMAALLAYLQKFDEAMTCYAHLAKLQPGAARTHETLGCILLRQKGAGAAIEHFRRAVEVDPGLLSAWNSLGLALQSQGEFEQAAQCFRKMLDIRPNLAVAHKHLVAASREKASREQIQPLFELLNAPNLTSEQRITACFALGTALDDAERYDEAFEFFAQANALTKAARNAVGERYDRERFHLEVDATIQQFTAAFFEQRRRCGIETEIPVFVVGMPRSGTTLVQQIAASHPRVFGAGELKSIGDLAVKFRQHHGPDPDQWPREEIEKAARQHLEFLQKKGGDAARVIDKMPANLHQLGLISLLFPNCRAIFCKRDWRDTCLSCYFQGFGSGNIFSYDLADCGHYQLENDRLMEHWRSVRPLEILEIQYEELVADLEGQSRRLIGFLGLEWDGACMEFYKAQTTVLTSSVWQVRQPIYNKSVGRWKHYERHLGPLLQALKEQKKMPRNNFVAPENLQDDA